MTDDEIRAYIDRAIAERMEQQPKTVGTNGVFKPTITKWFRDDRGALHGARMTKALGGQHMTPEVWAVWEAIRKIAVKMCRASRVEQIQDADKANRYADAICQCIYDLVRGEADSE